MREIKFRAWSKEYDMMIDVEKYSFTTNRVYYDSEWGDFELMQYTGLNDKNGKEMYEGDVIKTKAYLGFNQKTNDYDDTIDDITYIIKFGVYMQDGSGDEYEPTECLGFYAEVIQKDYVLEYDYTNSILKIGSCEIIGNIYENPELQEVEI